jgi:hypothetical protein
MIPARAPSPDLSTPSLPLPREGKGTTVPNTMPPSRTTTVVALHSPCRGGGHAARHTLPARRTRR